MTINVSTTRIIEGNSGASDLVVTFSISSNEQTSEHWTVDPDGAHPVNGSDFVLGVVPSSDVTFPNGSGIQQAIIQIAGDITYEPDETFRIEGDYPVPFQYATGFDGTPAYKYILLTDVSPVITIVNDDMAPPITLAGTHDQYVVTLTSTTQGTIQDTVAGRDGTQAIVGPTNLTFSDGVGVFDATGNAEVVAHLYQAAFGMRPDLGGEDYWTEALDSGQTNATGVSGSFVTSPEFNQLYGATSNDAFVAQLYANVLGRSGDSGGVQFWNGQLAAGVSRGSVLLGFAESQENIQNSLTTSGDPSYGEAYRLYRAALDRTPDASGLSFWLTALQSGATPAQVAAGFAASPEFVSSTGSLSNSDFVGSLYQNVLGRAGDAAGQQYWTAQLTAGAQRSDVLLGFSDSAENRASTTAATHDGWVFLPQQSS